MAVIDKDFVKSMFPEWEKFCTIKDDTLTADERLDNCIELAENEFAQYLPDVTDDDLTDVQRRHLLNLVRKQCFDLRHGDSGFDNKPQIVKDYEASIEWLSRMVADTKISISAKVRRFDGWFNDTGAETIVNSND